QWNSQGTSYHAVAMPLGKTRWTYVAALPTATFEAATQDLLRTSALAVAIGLVLAIGLTFLLTRPMTSGLRRLAAAASRLAQGDIEQENITAGRDEIGQMATAFGEVKSYLRELAEAADAMAAGDLSREVRVASDRDDLGQAFARMRTS